MGNWAQLTEELDRWHGVGATATFWWRDDDAVEPTPQLEVLLKHAGAIPLALAVIPGLVTRELPERLQGLSSVVVLQHGWRHASRVLGGNNEYPACRPEEDVLRELVEGRVLLMTLFGPQAIPVFVPPWQALDECFLPILRRGGLMGISRKGPRTGPFAAKGLLQANAHVSPIRWSVPPSFGDDGVYLQAVADHLHGRRLGLCDRAEPTGLLTHHLVQDPRSYEFVSRFVEIVSCHRAAAWLNAREIFAPKTNTG
jgi:hypothetical protein